MNSKKWIRAWVIIIITIPFVGLFNYLIDPLSINKNQLLDFKKIVQTIRDEKVLAVKSLDNIDNLVLGSSSSMRINPKEIDKFLDGRTFNFSVNSALPEDYYGILLYLERIGKVPQNVIIGFDFYILNDRLGYDSRFVSNKELNFIDTSNTKSNLLTNYLNINTLNLSIKTIYHNILGTDKTDKFDTDNGFLYWSKKDDLIKGGSYKNLQEIKSYSLEYFNGKYSNEKYDKFSNERIEYLKKIRDFSKKYNITLYTYLTPVHCYHLAKIKNHKLLGNTLIKFKSLLSAQFNYVDFMIQNKVNCKDENYYDATHQSYLVNKLIVNDLFTDFPTYGIKSN
jgi:hypothetical protein